MVKTTVTRKVRKKKKANVVSDAVKKQINDFCEAHKGPDLRRHYKLNEVPAWVGDKEDECYAHTRQVIEAGINERQMERLYKLARDERQKKQKEEAGINNKCVHACPFIVCMQYYCMLLKLCTNLFFVADVGDESATSAAAASNIHYEDDGTFFFCSCV